MAITSLAQVRSGLQLPVLHQKSMSSNNTGNSWETGWTVAGMPTAGAFSTSGINGATLTSPVTGQIPFNDPSSGNAYLARWETSCTGISLSNSSANAPLLVDRIWHNNGYDPTSTLAQTSTTPTFPARDMDGSSNGRGYWIGLEIHTTMGAANPVVTVSYTNNAGTAGRTATLANPISLSGQPARTMHPFGLEAGDVGVKSIESLTLSTSWLSGTFGLVVFRPIVMMATPRSGRPTTVDAISGGMPRLYNGSVPFFINLLFAQNNVTRQYCGQAQFTHG